MTDEEKAEEIIKEKYCNNCEEREIFPNIYNCSNKEHCDDYYLLKEGILLGLAEGRKEKWHDLRKNPDDLPKETGHYLTDDGEVYIYDADYRKWRTLMCMACWDFDWLDDGDILAWCEIPKFEE